MDHPRAKWAYLPTAINNITPEQLASEEPEVPERPGIYICPCCGLPRSAGRGHCLYLPGLYVGKRRIYVFG